ncbi:MAG: LicD family protein [Alphaproteobacteria bacterium]|nr:LicD family protein [Alphaproteobacteria bacterium]
MKRTLFRILAFPLPTRKLRNIVRRWGGPKITKPDYIGQILNILSASIDINHIPQARGIMKYIQDSNLKLLNTFDKFTQIHNIKYFMIGGAIAGKLRYNNCIPWDDDIDVGMLSDDYCKFIKIIKHCIPNKYFYALFTSNVCRIIHTETKAFLDILRYDVHHSPNCYKEQNEQKLREQLEKFRTKRSDVPFMHFELTNSLTHKDIEKKYNIIEADFELTKKIHQSIFCNNTDQSKTIFPMHADCKPGEFYDYSTIFPTKRLKFNKYYFWFPKDLELYATKCWGNIYSFPNDMFRHHMFSQDISPKKLIALREFLNLSDQDVFNQFCSKDK